MESSSAVVVPVTVESFVRAESHLYFGRIIEEGELGRFAHRREVAAIDAQVVIRMNRDTLYSAAVFDLDAAPVTITLPDAGRRFMSLQVVSEDHHTPATYYGAGAYVLDRSTVGTRYGAAIVRTLVDPGSQVDRAEVHALQDAMRVEQRVRGSFETPSWDRASQKKVRDALLVLAATVPEFTRAAGAKGDVDPIEHLLYAARGWGGLPRTDAVYVNPSPPRNDGVTVHRLRVTDVPVDGFWSVSVYNAEGYFEKNAYDAYSVNGITAKRSADGVIEIQFGGCGGDIPNCLPVMKGWNYEVRLYRPRPQILDGSWKFPEAEPVE